MTATNTLKLLVDEKAHGYAKIYASLLKDEFQRKRAYASIVALYALIDALEKTDNDIQKSMTLFRNPLLNEQYEISDVYINNWHIDVRILIDGDSFLVPKSHFDNDLQPDFYAVIKVDKTLTTAELLGFVDTINLEKYEFDNNYYSVLISSLITYDEFLQKVVNPKLISFSEEEHEFFRNSYLSILDDELDSQTKNRLLKHLFECAQCRTEFCCYTGFEMVSCNIGKYPDLLEDQTLNIIGAQVVDDKKYEGKEEIISLEDNLDTLPSSTAEENNNIEKEESVSDILDELFNIDEGFIETAQEVKEEVIIPQPTISDSGELEIIEDLTSEESFSQVQELTGAESYQADNIQTSKDLEIIEDNTLVELEANNDEVVLLENEPVIISEDDLKLPKETATNVSDELIPHEEEVQKVIVDYDEFGEPIYSYVTNVAPTTKIEELDDATEIEPLEDDILNEEFETYPQEIKEDFQEINSGMNCPVEYVENVEQTDVASSDDNVCEIVEESALDEILDSVSDVEDEASDIEFEEYKEESDVEIKEFSELDNLQDDDEQVEDEDENEVVQDILANEENFEESEEEQDEYDELEEDEEVQEYKDDENDDDDTENFEDIDYTDEEYSEDEENVEYDDSEYEENDESYEDDENEEDENEEGIDIPEENIAKPVSRKKLVILSALIIISLVGAGVAFWLTAGKKSQQVSQNTQPTETPIEVPVVENQETPENPQVSDMFEAVEGDGLGIEIPQAESKSSEASTAPVSELPPPPPMDVNQNVQQAPVVQKNTPEQISNSIAKAFSPNGNTVALRAVNWLCSPQLFSDKTFTAYLQTLDNILKLNLRKNILDVSEKPQNNSVTAKMAVDNFGNLKKVVIAETSGSEQIDNIVLQSINETFEGEKSEILSDSAQKADMYYLKVVIKL